MIYIARKKKEGRIETGIYVKKGMLYIITTQNVIKDGKCCNKKIWHSTGLKYTSDNLKIAHQLRVTLLKKDSRLLVDRDCTISEYIDKYLEIKQRNVANSTYSSYKQRASRIKEFFGNKRIKVINRKSVEEFFDYLVVSRLCHERTVKDIRSFLGSIFENAMKESLITFNPVKEASLNKNLIDQNAKPKDESSSFFSYKEAQKFLSVVEEHELYEMFFMILFYGLRREEVLGLRWSCVDFENKSFVINHTVTKGTKINYLNVAKTKDSIREYPLDDEKIYILMHLKDKQNKYKQIFGDQYIENDYIFKHEDGSLYYPDYPTKAFSKIIKKNPELPQGITLHGLRKSCVSILVHQGYDPSSIQKWVGHKDINTTLKIYSKVKEKEAKQEILEGLNIIIHPKKYDNDN